MKSGGSFRVADQRLVVRFWLWFCFKPVDVRHPERVQADSPRLLCINRPNHLIVDKGRRPALPSGARLGCIR